MTIWNQVNLSVQCCSNKWYELGKMCLEHTFIINIKMLANKWLDEFK